MSHRRRGPVDLAAHMAAKQGSTPSSDDMTHGIDVYDHEIIEIGKVMDTLNARSRHQMRNYADFDREIHERFNEIGLIVNTHWYHTNVESVKMPEITIMGRIDPKPFDRDQQVHEVTHDILGLGEGGVIKTDPGKVAALRDGTFNGGEVHKH